MTTKLMKIFVDSANLLGIEGALERGFFTSILGAIAAAVTFERQGNVPVSPAEAEEKVNALERRARFA
jgi:hypothetical protein